jgi:DNA-binding CsgD family transcriptional regulator
MGPVLHLMLGFYLLALLTGTAAISMTFMIWQRHRKAVIRRYGWFLLALCLLLLGFMAELYMRIMGWSQAPAARHVLWILQAAGGLTFIICAPPFYDSLLGLRPRTWKRILFFSLDALSVLAAGLNLVLPSFAFTAVLLNAVLFALIAYGLVLIAANLANVGERILRRALTVFFVLSLCFFPLMYIDAAMSYFPFLRVFAFLEGLAEPLYFLALNALSIAFGLRYLNRPAYAEAGRLTEFFVSSYKVTGREQEIIRLLLEGASGKAIGERLFISAKTVENHIYNLYQKLGVKNRVQLYRFIRANTL